MLWQWRPAKFRGRARFQPFLTVFAVNGGGAVASGGTARVFLVGMSVIGPEG